MGGAQGRVLDRADGLDGRGLLRGGPWTVPLYRVRGGSVLQRDIHIIRAFVTAWLDHVRLLDASIRDLESRIREACGEVVA